MSFQNSYVKVLAPSFQNVILLRNKVVSDVGSSDEVMLE